jgi:hypothetical protein
MMNPFEDDHKLLEKLIHDMNVALGRGKDGDTEFFASYEALLPLSRDVLKREWNRVKDKIQQS